MKWSWTPIGDEKTILFFDYEATRIPRSFSPKPAYQPAVTVQMINTAAVCPCWLISGRVRQHRADSQLRQADRHHPQPGNRHPFSEPVAAKKPSTRMRPKSFRTTICSLSSGQECQRDLRCAGERNHRFQHQCRVLQTSHGLKDQPAVRKGVDVRGRNRNHGRRQVHLAAAGREAVLLGSLIKAPDATSTLPDADKKKYL